MLMLILFLKVFLLLSMCLLFQWYIFNYYFFFFLRSFPSASFHLVKIDVPGFLYFIIIYFREWESNEIVFSMPTRPTKQTRFGWYSGIYFRWQFLASYVYLFFIRVVCSCTVWECVYILIHLHRSWHIFCILFIVIDLFNVNFCWSFVVYACVFVFNSIYC